MIAERRDRRLAEAQHEREGQAAALRFIDEARQAFARLGFAADFEAERREKRDLGLGRNDRALAARRQTIPPAIPAALGELVDRLERWARRTRRPPLAVRASARMSEERA